MQYPVDATKTLMNFPFFIDMPVFILRWTGNIAHDMYIFQIQLSYFNSSFFLVGKRAIVINLDTGSVLEIKNKNKNKNHNIIRIGDRSLAVVLAKFN